MKNFYSFFLLGCIVISSYAQSFKIETSALIKEDIGKPVLLLADGSTIFLNFDLKKKKGSLSILDSQHSLIVSNTNISIKKITDYIGSLYEGGEFWAEINGKIVLYVSGKEGLVQLIINSKTGVIENEILVDSDSEMEKDYKFRKIDASRVFMLKKSYKTNDLKVLEKNNSYLNNQFVTFFELNENGKINELNYDYLNNEFNAIGWIYDIVVLNSNSIGVVTALKKYSNFADYKGTKKNQMNGLYFIKINLKSKKTEHLKLDEIKVGESYSRGVIQYKSDISTAYLVLYKIVEKSKNYASLITTEFYDIFGLSINTESFKVEKKIDFATNKMIDHLKSSYENAESYSNQVVYSSWLDKNGNYQTITSQNFSVSLNPEMYFINPRIFCFNTYNSDGKELTTNSYRFECNESFYDLFFQKTVITKNDAYFFVNNIPENEGLSSGQKVKIFDQIKKTDTYYIKPDKEKLSLEKLFANESNSYLVFSKSLYVNDANTLVAIKMNKEGKERRVVWIKFN